MQAIPSKSTSMYCIGICLFLDVILKSCSVKLIVHVKCCIQYERIFYIIKTREKIQTPEDDNSSLLTLSEKK